MEFDNFSTKQRSRAGGKRCPDCDTVSCFPTRVFNSVVYNRLICECGRVVDGKGHRIRAACYDKAHGEEKGEGRSGC